MPIFEYRCLVCGRKSSFLVLSRDNPPGIACRHCGGREMEKLVSRVAILRSEADRLERMADSAETAGVDENDPRSVSRWMKSMGRELGEEMGEDFDRSYEEAMEGGAGDEPGGSGDAERPGPGLGEESPPDSATEED